MNVELTSARVAKGPQTLVAPKLKQRARVKVAVVPVCPEQAEAVCSPSAAGVAAESPAPAQPTDLKSSLVVRVALPSISKGTRISLPTAPEPVQGTAAPEVGGEDINHVSIRQLIRSKFSSGQLSQSEVERRRGKRDVVIERPKSPTIAPQTVAAPQFRLVNGSIQIDTASLQVTQQQDSYNDMVRVDEDIVRRVTSASFRNKKMGLKFKWTAMMTERFFEGLSYFGTDFELISLMFPELTRKHLKLKFTAEERRNPMRITQALREPKEPDEALRQRMKDRIPDKKELYLAQYVHPPTIEDDVQRVKPDIKRIVDEEQKGQDDNDAEPESTEPVDTAVPVLAEAVDTIQEHIDLTLSMSKPRVVTGPVFAPTIPSRRRKRPLVEIASEVAPEI